MSAKLMALYPADQLPKALLRDEPFGRLVNIDKPGKTLQSELAHIAEEHCGGGYPGDSNWTSGDFTQGIWEVWSDRKGDMARAMMYMDVRYEGGQHGGTGANEPDLILTR